MVIKLKAVHTNAVAPKRKTQRASGADLYSVEEFTVQPRSWILADTGLVVADMPELAGYLDKSPVKLPHEHAEVGLELQVRSRSGEAVKRGIFVLNQPGTIDQDYRGPIGVIMANFSDAPVTFPAGSRIAQVVCSLILYVDYELSEEVSETERGAGGFGSTGRA